MAKKAKGKRGAIGIEERKKRLQAKIGDKGIKSAEAITKEHSADVVRYAYLLLPRAQGAGKLGARIEALLATMSEDESAEVREKLSKAKEQTSKD